MLRDINGCVIAENGGWDNDCALHYSEEVLNHIVNYKEFQLVYCRIKQDRVGKI